MKKLSVFYVFVIIPFITFFMSMRIINDKELMLTDRVMFPIYYIGLMLGGFFSSFILRGTKKRVLFWILLLNIFLVILISNVSFQLLHNSISNSEMGVLLVPLVFGMMVILPAIFLTLIGSAIGLYTKTKLIAKGKFNE